jgi:deoxyribodipyrimidine photo-lyase
MKRLLWFRRDLRVSDNPLLSYEGEVLPIFIFDTNILSKVPKNDKRVSYIFSQVVKLKNDLQKLSLDLKVFYGKPTQIIQKLQELYGFDEVIASGDFDTYAKERDKKVSHILEFRYLQDSYIFKHNEVLKEDGSIYYVFTPFYKKALKVLEKKNFQKVALAELELLKENYEGLFCLENNAFLEKKLFLESFGFEKQELHQIALEEKLKDLKHKICNYKENRDFFYKEATSNLSLELRFGVVGVRELLRIVSPLAGGESFVRQLIFRDYYAYLLFHNPHLERQNFKHKYNGQENKEKFQRFCEASTGVPIVDAGVRELLQSGNMHNRVRMIVASFFTKDLLLPWQWGERFFSRHLLDYDKASNVLSWQWSAGTGVDPQPYFRVFNPYLQSKKYDPDALYIKKYLPELQHIDSKHLHNEEYLHQNSIDGYPKPLVFHKEAAKIAIESFKNFK